MDISAEENNLVPEKPEGGAAETEEPAQTETKPAATASQPARSSATTTSLPKPEPKPDPVTPLANGPYVVQVGSYGSSENADKEAARLKSAGYDALVKVGNTSDGSIIYRVRIGYFRSRADADRFIRENRKLVGGAIAAHR